MSIGKIVITGAKGKVGGVLCPNLNNYDLSCPTYPWTDCRNYKHVLRAFRGHAVAIHLAWNQVENMRARDCAPENTAMFLNVYKAAMENEVKRVIMASSVHADDFYGWDQTELMTASQEPKPKCVYGENKVFMERLGRKYAKCGLEVVCIRLGGINTESVHKGNPPHEQSVFLHHDDLVSAYRAVIDAPSVPDGFAVFYAVSDTVSRRHDLSNPFGWKPPFRSYD